MAQQNLENSNRITSTKMPKWPTREKDKSRHAITTEDKSPQEVYSFWRDLQNLPRFFQ